MLSLIAAMANNRVIGRDNDLPWRMPADLRHFKNTTLGHTIIMGRKNYESIGRPLPQRNNIVISRNPEYDAPGCQLVTSFDAALEAAQGDEEIFIIGGASIYQLALPLADRLYLTLIDAEIDGDTHFPEFDWNRWRESRREVHSADSDNPYPYSFVQLERQA